MKKQPDIMDYKSEGFKFEILPMAKRAEYIEDLNKHIDHLESQLSESKKALKSISEDNMQCAFMAEDIKTCACHRMKEIAQKAMA